MIDGQVTGCQGLGESTAEEAALERGLRHLTQGTEGCGGVGEQALQGSEGCEGVGAGAPLEGRNRWTHSGAREEPIMVRCDAGGVSLSRE